MKQFSRAQFGSFPKLFKDLLIRCEKRIIRLQICILTSVLSFHLNNNNNNRDDPGTYSPQSERWECPAGLRGQTVCNVIGSAWCLLSGFLAHRLHTATSVGDQRRLNKSIQRCRISRHVTLAAVWGSRQQAQVAPGTVLTPHPGGCNAVKAGSEGSELGPGRVPEARLMLPVVIFFRLLRKEASLWAWMGVNQRWNILSGIWFCDLGDFSHEILPDSDLQCVKT